MKIKEVIEQIKTKGLESCPYANQLIADVIDAQNPQDDLELSPYDLEYDPYGSDWGTDV